MSAATPLTLTPLREVRLYGHLGREFGRVHRLAVDSAAEAVRALTVLFPRFRAAVLERQRYQVLLGRGESRHAIGEQALQLRLGSTDCVRIVPVVEGAKRKGLGQTIVGLVLIAAGVYFNVPWLTQLGVSMVLGGVQQLLSPQRSSPTGDKKQQASYFMDGPVNVTEQGGPVPLVIGRVICGSTVVSSGLHADDISPAPAPPMMPPDLPYDQAATPWDSGQAGRDAYGDRGS